MGVDWLHSLVKKLLGNMLLPVAPMADHARLLIKLLFFRDNNIGQPFLGPAQSLKAVIGRLVESGLFKIEPLRTGEIDPLGGGHQKGQPALSHLVG